VLPSDHRWLRSRGVATAHLGDVIDGRLRRIDLPAVLGSWARAMSDCRRRDGCLAAKTSRRSPPISPHGIRVSHRRAPRIDGDAAGELDSSRATEIDITLHGP
jgi:hypothetical protein